MQNDNNKVLLKDAVSEIRMLRRQNEIMGARLNMFDDMMTLFRTPPLYPGPGMSPDLTYAIEKHLASEENEKSDRN